MCARKTGRGKGETCAKKTGAGVAPCVGLVVAEGCVCIYIYIKYELLKNICLFNIFDHLAF
jgi:hypothetical protein